MATGTTNPPGSADAIDLQANAINIDLWATGSSASAPDRLGVPRKTLFGMQSEFEVALAGMAYETPVPYAAGIVMSRPTQLVQYLGENYKVKTGLLPFTTSGVFATDSPSLVGVGDAVLRQDLLASGGAARVFFLQSGTGAFARSLESREREHVSVTDFMSNAQRADALTGSPVLDHAPAFVSFLARLLISGGRGRIPKGTYKLDTNVIGNWTQVVEYDEGAVMTGAGILFAVQHIKNKIISTTEIRRGVADVTTGTVGKYDVITSEGAAGCYGSRQDYRQTTTHTSGFSLGKGNICQWDSIDGGAGQSEWVVATTPTLASAGTWGVVTHEHNIMNRGPDNGYKKTRGESARWCGGIQLVPESDDLAGGTGNICRNALFAFASAHSSHVNDLGFQCKFYNGLLIEKDSIGPVGRGVLASGDTSGTPSQLPYAGLEIDQRWTTGIDTQAATFTSNNALILGNSHQFTWTNTGNAIGSTGGNIFINSAVSQGINMNPGGARAATFAYVASAVNFLNMFGGAGSAGPAIGVGGPGTDIDLAVQPKGTGVLDYKKAAVAATTPANFTATHMVDFKFNGVAYKIPARVAAW